MSRPLILASAVFVLNLPSVALANTAARAKSVAPQAAAPIEFPFEPRGVYTLVAAPGRITDIALETGERLVETNAIAAGDTARWIIGDTTSGAGATRRVHVLVKPTAANLSTNLVINTDRRTYFLDLRASPSAYVTQAFWRYPEPLRAIPVGPAPPALAPRPKLNFDYEVRGARSLRPLQVYDDGARVWLIFGDRLRVEDLPSLYRVGQDGKTAELINYHVEGRALVVDRLFQRAQLRLGGKRFASRVRITRTGVSQEAVR